MKAVYKDFLISEIKKTRAKLGKEDWDFSKRNSLENLETLKKSLETELFVSNKIKEQIGGFVGAPLKGNLKKINDKTTQVLWRLLEEIVEKDEI